MMTKTLTLVKEGDGTADTLSSVTVPQKFYNRLMTGIEVIDTLFGGDVTPGILPGSYTLATGTPGAGKTTCMLQLSDLLTQVAGRSLLYNANEESKPMVKLAADRIKVKGDFKISQIHDIDTLVRYVLDEGIEVLVQDSLQTLADGDLSGQNLLKAVNRKLVRLSKDHDVTVFAIGQVTKGGEMAGPMALKHEADAHLHMFLDKESGNRVFTMQKNRFGPAGLSYEFVLSAHGLDFKRVDLPQEGGAPASSMGGPPPVSRQVERRGEVQRVIRERLLAGEHVSGYCFERLNVDCSGGYWRGMLRLVVEQLKREGQAVGETRINGRLHSFVAELEEAG